MNTTPIVWKQGTSTNGRWGMDVMVPSQEALDYVNISIENNQMPEGVIQDLDTVAKRRVLLFTPQVGVSTYICFADKVLEGGVEVATMDLQSNDSMTVLLLSSVAIIQSFGYKGRSTSITLVKNGKCQSLTSSQLLVLGLLKPSEMPITIPIPPKIPTEMELALAKLGL